MRHLYYILVVVLLISACDEEEAQREISLSLQMLPHNSNNEFYASVPVEFGVKASGNTQPLYITEMELFVNGSRVEAEYLLYSFAEPGTYQLRAKLKMSDNKMYEVDTIMNIVIGPSLIGDPERGEAALFGWRTETSYKILMSSYYGSSVQDYEVLSLDESLKPQGAFKKMDFGWYPEIYDYGVSASGKLGIIYDNFFKIYDESLNLEHQLYFNYGNTPRKIFISDNNAVLLFDSLAHITLSKVALSTGMITEGSTQFMGVNDLTIYNHFFQDESRIATYYIGPNNIRTLLMGSHVGNNVEYSHYFQPPMYIDNVTPISSGGYVINTSISEEKKVNVLVADVSNVIKWNRTITMNFRNYWYNIPGYRIVVKELGGFIYVFFDNMRCVKLSTDGQLIWDKYFYPEIARLDDVLITSNGEFILIGTCLPYSRNSNIDFQKRQDVLCIRIDNNGFRVGV